MKDRLNQFIDNLNGQFVELSSKTALYQCMDLAYAWTFVLGFPKATIQNGYAYQVWTAPKDITRVHFELIPNSPTAIPQDGDLVIWSNSYGPAGHIAIALGGGTVNSFMCFEQNNPLGTNAHVQSRSYTHVLGWLRPKVSVSATPSPITDQSKYDFGQDFGVIELQVGRSKLQELKNRSNDQNNQINALNSRISQIRVLAQ